MYRILLNVAAIVFVAQSAFAAVDGETKTESLYPTPNNKVNVRVSPLSFVVGMPALSVHYAISKKVSLGLGGMLMTSDKAVKEAIQGSTSRDMNDFEIGANAVEARADIALGAGYIMEDTVYVSPVLQRMEVSVEDTLLNQTGTAEMLMAKAIIGYQWMWDHFNINVGGGLQTALSEEYTFENIKGIEDEDVESIGTGLALEFGLGLAF